MMWHTSIYYMMILYDDEMSRGHGDDYVVLRAPIDGPMIGCIWGDYIFTPPRLVGR